jgi:hypothetical protein
MDHLEAPEGLLEGRLDVEDAFPLDRLPHPAEHRVHDCLSTRPLPNHFCHRMSQSVNGSWDKGI